MPQTQKLTSQLQKTGSDQIHSVQERKSLEHEHIYISDATRQNLLEDLIKTFRSLYLPFILKIFFGDIPSPLPPLVPLPLGTKQNTPLIASAYRFQVKII